jgi:16S rRNA (cytosine967-C5)-methyltransferase
VFLDKVPKAAAVNEAVEMVKAARKRSAAGLVNAVLRKCEPLRGLPGPERGRGGDPDGESGAPGPEALESARHSFPRWLLDRWERHFGSEAAGSLVWSSVLAPRTCLRVAGGADALEEIQRELAEEGIETRTGKYGQHALVVGSGDVRSSALARDGRIAIQDEASQLVAELVAPRPCQRVLDLCAAPGIKTAQLASAMGSGALVASDISAGRLRTMLKLLERPPLPTGLQLHVVRLDAARPLPFAAKFDRVLLDAPCSGTGTLGRNPEIKWRLKVDDLARLAQMQAEMLRNAIDVLTPGGRLVYATCSLEPEENERVVEGVLAGNQGSSRLLSRGELTREFPDLSPLFDPRGYFRTRPDLHSMDGFFAAAVVRDA